MTNEVRYVRTGWSMGVGNTLSVRVRVDSHQAEKISEEQWISYGIEVEKHMQAILDFLENKIWPDQSQAEAAKQKRSPTSNTDADKNNLTGDDS